jgi:hypothetical protein
MKPTPENFSKFKKLAISRGGSLKGIRFMRADAKNFSGDLTNHCWGKTAQLLAIK